MGNFIVYQVRDDPPCEKIEIVVQKVIYKDASGVELQLNDGPEYQIRYVRRDKNEKTAGTGPADFRKNKGIFFIPERDEPKRNGHRTGKEYYHGSAYHRLNGVAIPDIRGGMFAFPL